MTNERNETGIDPLVSDTYGELADEKTPDSLNQSVLRMAAREGKTPYSIARAWMRPAAWAATIGLSLAVVLQLTNLPEADLTGDSALMSVPLEEQELETAAMDERQEATAPAKRSRPQSHQENGAGKVAVQNDAPAASAEIADAGSNMNVAAPETPALETQAMETRALETQAMETRASETQAMETRASETQAPDTRSVASAPAQDEDAANRAIAPRSTSVIQQSGEHARLQAGSEPEPVVERKATTEALAARTPSTEAFSAGVASLQATSGQLCPDEARESAEKWSECITALEDTFPQEFIDREIEEFRKSFPEFERDTVDK